MKNIKKEQLLNEIGHFSKFSFYFGGVSENLSNNKEQKHNLSKNTLEEAINEALEMKIKDCNKKIEIGKKILKNEKRIKTKIKTYFFLKRNPQFQKKYKNTIQKKKDDITDAEIFLSKSSKEKEKFLDIKTIPNILKVNNYLQNKEKIYIVKLYISYENNKPRISYSIKEEKVIKHVIEPSTKDSKFDYIITNITDTENFSLDKCDHRYEEYNSNILKHKHHNKFIIFTEEDKKEFIKSIEE